MRERTDHVKDIHAEILSSPDGGDRNNELEDVMAEVKRLASRIQGALKMIKQKAEEAINENPTSAVSRMKLIQQQTLSKVVKLSPIADCMRAFTLVRTISARVCFP